MDSNRPEAILTLRAHSVRPKRWRVLSNPGGFVHNTPILINKKAPIRGLFIDMAERVGFEPTKGY